MNYALGAMLPPELEWQMGKTAGSICFVGQAEAILEESKLSAETAQRLRDRIERVKSGEESIVVEMTDQQIINEAL